MARNKEVAERESQTAATRERTQGTEPAIRPPVDVFEDADGITLQADMPGVSKDRLELRVDGNTLLVEGGVQLELSEGMEALHADVRSTAFRRTFTLSSGLDADKIEANLKNGVLTVRIPKRAELKPRRIDVRAS